jgi:hypothetical protein
MWIYGRETVGRPGLRSIWSRPLTRGFCLGVAFWGAARKHRFRADVKGLLKQPVSGGRGIARAAFGHEQFGLARAHVDERQAANRKPVSSAPTPP